MNRYYTDEKQCKELLKLGLKEETADMFYSYILPYYNHDESGWEGYDDHPTGEPYSNYSHNEGDWKKSREDLPCWSLGALMDMMPVIKNAAGNIYRPELCKGFDGKDWYINYNVHFTKWHKTPVDAAVEMIIWLIKHEYLMP